MQIDIRNRIMSYDQFTKDYLKKTTKNIVTSSELEQEYRKYLWGKKYSHKI